MVFPTPEAIAAEMQAAFEHELAEEEREHREMLAYQRKLRREELARDLLLKLVESTPGAIKYDTKFNVAKAIEYTDALLTELEKSDGPTDK